MGVVLEALEVHGHVKGAEPATAVAVVWGGISKQEACSKPFEGRKEKKRGLVSQQTAFKANGMKYYFLSI